jgi:hypothetical protein
MPSLAFDLWFADRSSALDEIENAHRSVGGTGPGRRTTTQQINQAYALLLSSQFQGFCRDLHTEGAKHFVTSITDVWLGLMLGNNLIFNRKLDRGNPNPGNIGSDFNRFNFVFWTLVEAQHPRNFQRRTALEELNEWRNAIAHHDFSTAMLRGGRPALQLSQVQSWRKACDGLVESFDEVLRVHLQNRMGTSPW